MLVELVSLDESIGQIVAQFLFSVRLLSESQQFVEAAAEIINPFDLGFVELGDENQQTGHETENCSN